MPQPRIRMFAGPNGSGKSTIKEYLLPHYIGAYLNADELEKELKETCRCNLKSYHQALKAVELIEFLQTKKRKNGPLLSSSPIIEPDENIIFQPDEVDSYQAARIIDFIRLKFIELKVSFTFETVMSHISKIEFLREAQKQGFRTYLYYVSTIDPDINIARVEYRVSQGGHPVPEIKIRERYYRSMDLLMQAIEASDRTYIFDNSSNGQKAAFIAEVENAEKLRVNPELLEVPRWFAEKVLSEFE